MIQIFNADCMEGMSRYPDKHFELAIVDPPYGIGEDGRKKESRENKGNGERRLSIDKRNGRVAAISINNYKVGNWDNKQPDQIYFDELFRVSKKVIIWGCNYIKFNQSVKSTGRIFWDKVNYDNDFSDGELAWTNCHSSIRQFEFMWNGMLQGKSITEGRVNQGNIKLKEKRIHPTHKPVALYKWLLHNYAKPGDKILDTHLGSGSSAVACHQMGFDLTAFEIDKDYFDAAMKRLKNEQKKLTLNF